MIAVATYLTCAFALAGAAFRLRPARGSRSAPGRHHLPAFALCIGVSMALVAPATNAVAESFGPICRLLPLFADQLKLAGECFLVLLAYSVQSAEPGRPIARRQAIGTTVVITASTVAYLAAGVAWTDGTISADGTGQVLLAFYNLLFLVHSCWCVVAFILVIHRSARELGPGLLRVGLRLVLAGAAAGLVWALWSAAPLLTGLTSGRQESGEDDVSAIAAVLALGLGIGGATLTAWAAYLTRPARWLRAWRDYRRIGPLWEALHAARPEIELTPPAGLLGRAGPPRDPEFALYRRVIEIHDGHLSLRAHFHPLAPRWAADAGCSAAEPAVLEAAVLAVALEAATAGRRFAGVADGDYAPSPARTDIAAETAWLVQVSQAFTGSAAVAEVRRRARGELQA